MTDESTTDQTPDDEPPAALLAFAPDLDRAFAREAWSRVPRFAPGRVEEIAVHVAVTFRACGALRSVLITSSDTPPGAPRWQCA